MSLKTYIIAAVIAMLAIGGVLVYSTMSDPGLPAPVSQLVHHPAERA